MLAVPFLLVFTAGLAAAVYTMLHGVTAAPAAGAVTRIGMITAPSVAAFAVVFGAVGYLCVTRTALSYPVIVLIALAGGAATIPLSAPLLAALARNRSALGDIEIEGQLATVTEPVTDARPGEVRYERDGREFRHRAVNLVGGTLLKGREVVIDRIENDTAYVEDWERVEKRL